MISSSLQIEAPFYDVDSCHIVWHGHYVKYFELARCKLLDDIGYNYLNMAATGYNFPVVELHIKYLKSVKFLQKIQVEAQLAEWKNKVVINYQIRDHQSGQIFTRGSTVQVAVDVASELLQFETPDVFCQKVAAMLEKNNTSI